MCLSVLTTGDGDHFSIGEYKRGDGLMVLTFTLCYKVRNTDTTLLLSEETKYSRLIKQPNYFYITSK